MSSKKYILDKETTDKKLHRMAYEILENNVGEKEIIIAGIRESGSIIAANIKKLLSDISDIKTTLISISLDKKMPGDIVLSETVDFNDKVILIVDDVANSGKTLLYALKPLLDFHPRRIQILVLVERTHKAFSIKPDYVGLSVATTFEEHIFVEVKNNEIIGAWME
jgi:pyrimidine operon attenuation protein/uracil phosphoribosyltransferase